jgi:DivIVA domain-containing protein
MPLTPEDVVNKRFQPTKFREGYDQDEVDDFLDEIVVELRRLGQENEDLRQRLLASESRIAELQRSGAGMAEQLTGTVDTGSTPVVPVVATSSFPEATQDPSTLDTNNTNNLLQLARKLHEEHVREGLAKRDALIAEGHATAARVVREAEAQQRADMSRLEQDKALIEHSIQELKSFEREYRIKLRSYIQGQLDDLEDAESTAPTAPAAPELGYGSAQPFAQQPSTQPSPGFGANPSFGAAPFNPSGFGATDPNTGYGYDD